MNITINMPTGSEVLEHDEIVQITGRLQARHQIEWLRANRWKHFLTGQGAPIVGRLYARMQLSGVVLSSTNWHALATNTTLTK